MTEPAAVLLHAWLGGLPAIVVLAVFLGVHTRRDLTAPAAAWYFRSTLLWLVVMTVGSIIYRRETQKLRRQGVDLDARFAALPPG